MIISFFDKDGQLDVDAVRGGVYHVELLKKESKHAISLYIGESAWIIERCGTHLYAFEEDCSYFGLAPEDLQQNFILKFSVLEPIKEKKRFWNKTYKEKELKWIKEFHPLTQNETSDRQKKDKFDIVQAAMRRKGFK